MRMRSLVVLTIIFWAGPSWSFQESAWVVGPFLGLSFPMEQGGADSEPDVGLKFMNYPSNDPGSWVGLGGYYGAAFPSGGHTHRLLGEIAFHFIEKHRNFYASALVGIEMRDTTTSSQLSFALLTGGLVGNDFSLGNNIYLAPEIALLVAGIGTGGSITLRAVLKWVL